MTSSPRHPAADVAAALGVPAVTWLGAGSFGDTWRTDDRAVKILCVDGYPADRVAREVDGLRRITSPHVVTLVKTGVVELGGKQRSFLEFEYIDGGDLQQRFDAAIAPGPDECRALLRGLLTGVQAMHAADGTVHRDIKPANVALRAGEWGSPVILDLGLARSVGEATLTLYPTQVGTWYYMSPEQIRGERARKAADLFAVGVTVRALYGGRHPFHAMTGTETADELHEAVLQPPRPLPAGLDAATARVLDLLVSPAQHERGSARSNLKRLEQT